MFRSDQLPGIEGVTTSVLDPRRSSGKKLAAIRRKLNASRMGQHGKMRHELKKLTAEEFVNGEFVITTREDEYHYQGSRKRKRGGKQNNMKKICVIDLTQDD